MVFGEWVAQQRKRRGWSLKRLADEMAAAGQTKASPQYIQQVERGEINPDRMGRDKLEALAAALGVSIGALLAAGGGPSPPLSPTLAELRTLAGDSPALASFLAELEQEQEYATEDTWHVLTQVFQGLVSADRAKQRAQRAQRADADTPAQQHEGDAHPGERGAVLARGC